MNISTIPFLVIDRPNILISAQQINCQTQVRIMTHACASNNFRKKIKSVNLIKICDSGVFLKASNRKHLTYSELFSRYEEMSVNYGIIFDVLGEASATIKEAKKAIKTYSNRERKWKLVGVAQGQNINEYAYCTRQLIKLGYQHIAIGGMLKKNQSTARYVRVKNNNFLENVLNEVRQNWSGWLFVLVCYHPKRVNLFEKYQLFGSDSKRWALQCQAGLSTKDRHSQLVRNFVSSYPSILKTNDSYTTAFV